MCVKRSSGSRRDVGCEYMQWFGYLRVRVVSFE